MYEIRPESIKTFITDRDVKLPRFQRKQTWDPKKNFQLCISLFKEWPLGVVTMHVDEKNGNRIRWLLDGRQRSNALREMYEDPANIYLWAQKFLRFSNNAQLFELKDIFYKKINKYIESEEELKSKKSTDDTDDTTAPVMEDDDDDDNAEYDVVDPTNNNSNSIAFSSDKPEDLTVRNSAFGLEFLFDIIKLIHNKNSKGNGFTRPFDFGDCITKLPYVKGNQLNSAALKLFIMDYHIFCDNRRLDCMDMDEFYGFIEERYNIIEGKQSKLKEKIAKNWEEITERITMVDKIDSLLSRSQIGVIEIKNLTAPDAQKIFNIINTEGAKLTAIEVLSAKPQWNIVVTNASESAELAVKRLYKDLDITGVTDVVRWDLAATFLGRLQDTIVFKKFKPYSVSKKDFESQMTYSFKALSAIFDFGIKKENIENLGSLPINWNSAIDEVISDYQLLLKIMCSSDYFKFFKTWNTSLMELTSDAVALDFFALIYLDWVRKDKPIGADTKTKQFQRNCFILWDRLIYEHACHRWRGSTDQYVAKDIKEMKDSKPDMSLLKPIPESTWLNLIDEIYDNNTINSFSVAQQFEKGILYHAYCMSNIGAPAYEPDVEIDVDHIIPQSKFKASQIGSDNPTLQDSLFNLGLLPKKDNIAKSDKSLLSIMDKSWLVNMVKTYEFIEKEDFEMFSDANNYPALFAKRKKFFVDAFTVFRRKLLNN